MMEWWEEVMSDMGNCSGTPVEQIGLKIKNKLTEVREQDNYWDDVLLAQFMAQPLLMTFMNDFLDAFDANKEQEMNYELAGYNCG